MNTLGQLNTYSAQSVGFTDEDLGVQTLPARYKINGVIDTSRPVMENMDKIASAAGSWMSYDSNEGKWGVIINQAGTSVASFDDSNILDEISISGTGLTDLFTGVNVEFPHRDLRDKADFVTIELPAGDLNANETTSIQNIAYDIINEPVQAQLLGFIELKQSRVDLVIKFQSDYSKSNLKAGELIDVTNARFGFANKLFRILSIFEKDDESGALIMEITALEYDPNVYSTADLYRYTRSDENGIITKGAIGTPGTPQVSKFERDSRPRVYIETLSPSGIVEGIEYWITYDISIQNDSNRNYRLLGTRQPTVNKTWPENSEVVFEWDSLASGDFYVKTRGVNSSVVGPFSQVSGLINYAPTQITNAINEDTAVVDNTGALLTALGGSLLMNAVSGLITGNASTGSLFKSIFSLFESETGTDLLGQAANGSLVVAGETGVAYNGSMLTTSTRLINFTGSAVNATANGNDVTVTINCCGTGTNGGGGGGTTGTNTGTTSTVVYYLNVVGKYPLDISPSSEYLDTPTGSTTGPYYIRFGGGPRGSLFAPVSPGTGKFDLYQSDGTLVGSMPIGSCTIENDLVSIPFPDREPGTDFYVLMDEGIVTYCDYISPKIDTPRVWNFATTVYASSSTVLTGNDLTSATVYVPEIYSHTPSNDQVGRVDSLFLTYNLGIKAGTGSFKIHEWISDNVVATLSASSTSTSGSTTGLGKITYGEPSTKYYVTSDATAVLYNEPDCHLESTPSKPITKADNVSFTMIEALECIQLILRTSPFEGDTEKTNRRTYLGLKFNRSIQRGDVGEIKLYSGSGTLVQKFDVTSSFETDKSSDIITIGKDAENDIIYINPTKAFQQGVEYYVTGTSGSVKDFKGFTWAGVSSPTALRFRVDPGPTPTLVPITDTSKNITMTFDREIEPGPGKIKVYDENNNLLGEIPSTDSSIEYQ